MFLSLSDRDSSLQCKIWSSTLMWVGNWFDPNIDIFLIYCNSGVCQLLCHSCKPFSIQYALNSDRPKFSR